MAGVKLPSMCNLFRAGARPPAAPTVALIACALQQSRITNITGNPGAGGPSGGRYIKFRPRFDVRQANGAAVADVLELPPGSGTLYAVNDVQDVYRDTPNEFRRALCSLLSFTLPLP